MYNPPVTAKPCHPPLHKGGFVAFLNSARGAFALIRHGYAVPPSPEGKALGKNESGVLFYSFSFSANLRVTSAHRWAASRSKVG